MLRPTSLPPGTGATLTGGKERPVSSDGSTYMTTTTISSTNHYSDRFIPSRLGSGDFLSAFELLGHQDQQHTYQNSDPNVPPASPTATDNTTTSSTTTTSAAASEASSARNSYSALLRSELLEAQTFDLSAPPTFVATCESAGRRPRSESQRPSSLKLDTTTTSTYYTPPATAAASISRTSLNLPVRRNGGGNKSTSIFRFHDRPLSAQHNYYYGADGGYLNTSLRTSSSSKAALMSLRALANSNAQPSARAMADIGAGVGRSGTAHSSARKISRIPFKVLDAPCLKDDFYLNLVDWSSRNVLAVGLGCCVYLWSAHTSVVTKLCELKFGGPICSVSWSLNGTELAIGTAAGLVQLWDTAACKLIRTMTGHTARVGCLTWSSTLLSSGGRDSHIFNRDLRTRESYVQKWSAHKHEVCGLKWSPDDTQLASGGNDNKLLVWNVHSSSSNNNNSDGNGRSRPRITYNQHSAAVKAIAWSPHSRGILASGGGTQDKKIRFWNTAKAGADSNSNSISDGDYNSPIAQVDTGSQVCNLAWSKNVNEIVSTHGYSQNQIVVWKYPTLTKVATLTGHALRVLYLAVSPSGESIVTGAGDETLRFWNIFPQQRGKRGCSEEISKLSSARMHIR